MIGEQRTGRLQGAVISAVAHEGLTVTINGEPAQLAIITADGRVFAAGQPVADEAQAVSINIYRAFLRAQGHLRVLGNPILEANAA